MNDGPPPLAPPFAPPLVAPPARPAEESVPARELFRKRALDRLTSPEQLHDRIRITRPAGWLALLATLAIIGGVGVWSVLGRLPDNATGQLLLLAEGGSILDVTSPTGGSVRRLDVQVGDLVAAGQVLGTLLHPETERDLRLARQVLAERQRDVERLAGLGAEEATARRNAMIRQREAAALRIRLSQQREQLARERLRNSDALYRERLVTLGSRAQLQQELAALLQEISNAESEVARSITEELELTRLSSQRLHDAELAVADAARQVVVAEEESTQATVLVSPAAGRVGEMRAQPGAQLRPGQSIMTLEQEGSGLTAALFVPADIGKRVQPGMPASIAPATARPEEYGTMLATVVEASRFPISREALRALVQNDDLVRRFFEQGAPVQVKLRLLPDSATASGYAWTSRRGNGVSLSAGTPGTGRVTLDERRPIELVVPALRALLQL